MSHILAFLGNPLFTRKINLCSGLSIDSTIQPKRLLRIGYTKDAAAPKYFDYRKVPSRGRASLEIAPSTESVAADELIALVQEKDKSHLVYAVPKLIRQTLNENPTCFDPFQKHAIYVPIASDRPKDKEMVMLKLVPNVCQKGVFWYWIYVPTKIQLRPDAYIAYMSQ